MNQSVNIKKKKISVSLYFILHILDK